MFFFIGTQAWFAPELCLDRPERSSFTSDVWAFGCILLEIISQKVPWDDVYKNDLVLIHALATPQNANIFENICRSQRGPEKLIKVLCDCCAWEKHERPTFPTICRELSALSDVDMHNIKQEEGKPISSNSPGMKSSTSNKQHKTKPASKTTDQKDVESLNPVISNLKLGTPSAKRKTSSNSQAVTSVNQSTNEEDQKYDPIKNRYLQKGSRGGWYYINSSGNKVYVKDDTD